MSFLPKGVNPADVMHPTGVLYRNPTHLNEAERAYEQSDIVKEIKKLGHSIVREVFTYDDLNNIKGFPGMVKINEMSEDELKKLFTTIVKYRPNVIRIRVATGTKYDDLQHVYHNKVSNVGSTHSRPSKEIAEPMAALFADDRLNVVDMLYQVTGATDGHFRAEATVFSSDKKYDDEYFCPVVEIEYHKHT